MSKSLIYASNSAAQEISANGIINFGQVVRRFGCNCSLSGGNVTIDGSGYYSVLVNVAIEPISAGYISVQLYKDGVAIPGAVAIISGVADTTYAVVIPGAMRQLCNCESTITAVVSSGATVSNAAIEIVKE